MAKTKVGNYVFRPGISYNSNKFLNAWNALTANKDFLKADLQYFLKTLIL